MTASKQEPETAEYQLVMKLEIPSKMREEGIRRYIHSQVFRDGWGEAFQTNYIHSKEFRVTRSTHSSQPVPVPDGEEFHFKSDVDMNALTKQIGDSLAEAIGSDPSKIKCKGIRIFYVNENDMLMSSGLFVKGFSPEDWDK